MKLIVAALAAFFLFAAVAAPPPSGKANGHATPEQLQLRPVHGRSDTGVECPPELDCQYAPAAYAQNSSDPGDYGNYDLANRPSDGLAIRYVVVHDTESSYDSTIAEFQDP